MKNKCSKAFCQCKRINRNWKKKSYRELRRIYLIWRFKKYSGIPGVFFASFIANIINNLFSTLPLFEILSPKIDYISLSDLLISFMPYHWFCLRYHQKFFLISNAGQPTAIFKGLSVYLNVLCFILLTFPAILILFPHLRFFVFFPWFFSSFRLPVLSSSSKILM